MRLWGLNYLVARLEKFTSESYTQVFKNFVKLVLDTSFLYLYDICSTWIKKVLKNKNDQ